MSEEENFFMMANPTRANSQSYTIKVEMDKMEAWEATLERYMVKHTPKVVTKSTIFKMDQITATIYPTTGKILVQSGNQEDNLDFINDKLAKMYDEVCKHKNNSPKQLQHEKPKFPCDICGKELTSATRLVTHVKKIHEKKTGTAKKDTNTSTTDNLKEMTTGTTAKNDTSNTDNKVSDLAKTQLIPEDLFIENIVEDIMVDVMEGEGQNMFSPSKLGPTSTNPVPHFLSATHPLHLFLKKDDEETKKLKDELKETKEKLKEAKEKLERHDDQQKELEETKEKLKQTEETLKRKDGEIKGLYESREEIINESKTLSKQLKESTDTVQKTLKAHQVLAEELEIKNAIIEADEKLKDNTNDDIKEAEEDDNEPTLSCLLCDFKTKNKQFMKGHMTKHKKRNTFNCTKCTKKFSQENAFKQHTNSQHKPQSPPPVGSSQWAQSRNVKEETCTKCPAVFKEKSQLEEHLNTNHKQKCIECADVFDSRDYLITHLREEHNIDIENDWNCESCHEVFNGYEALRNHKCQEQFQVPRQRKECWNFKQGRCHRGDSCWFGHTKRSDVRSHQQEQHRREYTEACRRGRECVYLAAGVCNFFHPRVGVQAPRQRGQGRPQGGQSWRQGGQEEGQGRRQGAQGGRQEGPQGGGGAINRPCKFGARCWAKPCRFNHGDFSQMQQFLENY